MIEREQNPGFLNEFLDYTVTILNKSPNTIKEYNYDLANFLKFLMLHFHLTNENDFSKINISNFDIEILRKVKLADIHAYLYYLKSNYSSKATTLSRKTSSIRVFFKYLRKSNLIEFNPAQDLETPKLEKRLPKYLNLEDSRKLLSATSEDKRNKERNYAIITIFLNCGIRLSELVGINIKHIDFSENKLNVIGKGNKERTIYLNDACISAINDYLKVRPHDGVKYDSKDALFLSEQRERISNRTVQYVVKNELKKVKLDNLSVHKLRHTAATLMYQYGHVDIRALQELLGHESIATTQIYTHVNNEQVRKAIESNPLSDFNSHKINKKEIAP